MATCSISRSFDFCEVASYNICDTLARGSQSVSQWLTKDQAVSVSRTILTIIATMYMYTNIESEVETNAMVINCQQHTIYTQVHVLLLRLKGKA